MTGVRDTLLKTVDAVCPHCGAQHRKQLRWVGSIPARLYCIPCALKVKHEKTVFIKRHTGRATSDHRY